ncbi:MAG: hypothetical protein HKM00_00040 [Gallionella sp.]|jgi:hypothetical protein|nr:hypothetical protein [Gallionella sp.]
MENATPNRSSQKGVMVDMLVMRPEAARAKVEELIFEGTKPSDKYDQAARNSFMNLVMKLMKDGGQLVKL